MYATEEFKEEHFHEDLIAPSTPVYICKLCGSVLLNRGNHLMDHVEWHLTLKSSLGLGLIN